MVVFLFISSQIFLHTNSTVEVINSIQVDPFEINLRTDGVKVSNIQGLYQSIALPHITVFFFLNVLTNVILCAIWYHLYNLKNVKNTHGKSETPPWMFFTLFTLYKWYQIAQCTTNTDYFRKPFDNYVTIGDFNMEPNNTTLKHFLDSNGLVKY